MNSIVIGGGSYDIGKVLLEERARRAQLESERQRMQMQAAADSQRMQQEAAANAMRMRNEQQQLQQQAARDAFSQQIENAKLAETERYRGVNDERARAQFGMTMDYNKAQLASLNEDRARRGTEFTEGLKSKEELKREEIAAKSQAEGLKAYQTRVKQAATELGRNKEHVVLGLSKQGSIADQEQGKRYLESIADDMADLQSKMDAGVVGDAPVIRTNLTELASWRGKLAGAQAKVEKEKAEFEELGKRRKEYLGAVDGALKRYATVRDPQSAIMQDPSIPPEYREQVANTMKMVHPFQRELEGYRQAIEGTPAVEADPELNTPAVDAQEPHPTPITYLREQISDWNDFLKKDEKSFSEIIPLRSLKLKGELSGKDLARLEQLEIDQDDFHTMKNKAMEISGGKNPGGAVSDLVSRLKSYLKQMEKNPDAIARETENAKAERAIKAQVDKEKAVPQQEIALGQIQGNMMDAAALSMLNPFGSEFREFRTSTNSGDIQRTLASRAMLAKLKELFPNKKTSEILSLMERAQSKYLGYAPGGGPVDNMQAALRTLE